MVNGDYLYHVMTTFPSLAVFVTLIPGGKGGWSDRGCRHVESADDNRTVCECDHLTHFAVLVVSSVFVFTKEMPLSCLNHLSEI